MPSFTTKEEPNMIASTSDSRLIGCLCEKIKVLLFDFIEAFS